MALRKRMSSRFTIQVPPEWQAFDPQRISGTVMVLGASDSGKTTLIRWMVGRLCGPHKRVGWIDGDIGQTTLGVPTTMNLAVLNEMTGALPRPMATFFVGATSPRRHMLPILVGMQRLREQALAAGAGVVVIDTTGLVAQGAGGGALKRWKIELLQPGTVIALQREREMDHILAPLKRDRRLNLHVLPVAETARHRTPEERAAWRKILFREYFEPAHEVHISYSRRKVYGLEHAKRFSLLACLDTEGFAMALGVVLAIRAGETEVLTPLSDVRRVAGLHIGALRVDPGTGEEQPI